MMLANLLLAWALVVQVQLQFCQEGVCTPHPQLQARSHVVRTLDTESDCLVLQMDLQREYHNIQQRVVPSGAMTRRRLERKTTFICQPSH
jgi:hypothetical protein